MYKKNNNQKSVRINFSRYDFYVHHAGKAYRKRIVCRKSEVDELHEQWIDEITSNENYSFCVNFETYLETVANRKVSYSHELSFYNNQAKLYFKNTDFRKIDRPAIIKFSHYRLDQGVKASTVNREIAILSTFFSWLILNNRYNRINPCHRTKLAAQNERHIQLTASQVNEIIQKSFEYDIATEVHLAVYAGMRRNEIITLHQSDIDFENRRIHIQKQFTKTKVARSIPIPDRLYHHLLTNFVACTRDQLRNRWELLRNTLTFADQLTVKRLTFHDLRHVYAQILRDAGVSLQDIQAFLGHRSVVTTESRYAQAGGYDAVNKVNLIDTILKPATNLQH